jgi:ABC-type Zn uptake system ZnuABC Zn-binding protein ZnuA
MVKKIISIQTATILTIVCLIFLTSCGKVEHKKPIVLTTIGPLALLVQDLLGEGFQIESILPPGASPHTFEPTPSIVTQVSNAKAIIANGILDAYINKLHSDSKRIVISEIIEKNGSLKLLEHHHDEDSSEHLEENHKAENKEEHENGHEENYNAHFFIDPKTMLICLPDISNFLVDVLPDNSQITTNTQSLELDIKEMTSYWKEKFSLLQNKSFFATHDTYIYLANTIGMDFAGSIQKYPGREPTISWISNLQKTANEKKVKVIIIEPELPNTASEMIASESNLKILKLSPLATKIDNTSKIKFKHTFTNYISCILEKLYNSLND